MDFNDIATLDTPPDIDRFHARATEAAEATVKRITTLINLSNERRAALEAEVEERVSRATAGEERRIVRQFAQRDADRLLGEFARNLREQSQQERDALTAAMQKQLDNVEAVASLNPSPAAMLARIGLGTTDHTNYVRALSGAGPVELENRAREAIMTGNRVLASAVLTVVDRMPRKNRPFSTADFAQRLFGQEHSELMRKVTEVRNAVSAANDLMHEFTRGRADPTSKIERGIAARKAAKAA